MTWVSPNRSVRNVANCAKIIQEERTNKFLITRGDGTKDVFC